MIPSRAPRWIVPALLATAALTAVLLHDDIPGLSGTAGRKASPPAAPATGGTAPLAKQAGRTAAELSPADAGAPDHLPAATASAATAADSSPAVSPDAGGLAAVVARSHKLEDSGTGSRNYVIALDEVSIHLANGHDQTRRLDPPATPETYQARVAEFAHEGTVMPVVYPEGEPKLPENRRLVTSQVKIEVPEGTDRATAAAKLDIPAEELPSYAPRLAVLKAGSPLEALAGLEEWRELPDFSSVEVLLAMQLAKRAMPNDPLVGSQWHLKYNGQFGAVAGTDINVEGVWNYPAAADAWRGAGVTVGVVDDGLQTDHPDLSANVNTTIDYDWNGDDTNPYPDDSSDRHGTACAGDVAARGNNNLGVSGSAPEATLVGMRLISGAVSDFEIAQAVSHEAQAIHVKTNSWGPSDTGSFLAGPGPLTQAALQNSAATGRGGKGTVFLWAGGNGAGNNDNSNKDGFANSIYALSVTALDSQMGRSYYAEPGANHLVTAPSNGLILGKTTTDLKGAQGYNETSGAAGDYTSSFGGTSSATPTAAGVVALMLQRNPNLGYRDVQEILAATAKKINPGDPGWGTNSGGFHFHHEYGAGLIDAGAAVAAAATWNNLAPAITASAITTDGAIPDRNVQGLVRTFDLSDQTAVRAEHVTLEVEINHSARGNLEILVTSPSGMTSRMAETHGDTNANYYWTFMSTHHRGEHSTGVWTMKVSDRSGTGNTTGGTLLSATLTVHGAPVASLNPPPVVQITSPANGAVFTPGSTVTVDVNATDLAQGGEPGGIAMVELLEGDVVLGTDTEAPYSFQISPSDGTHAFTARATDTDANPATATSATVNVTMENSPTTITAASIGVSPAYADTPLTVGGIVSNDPDGDTPTYAYQWQFSSDTLGYADAPGLTSATLPAAPANAGLLWRCRVTANDGQTDGPAFLTNSVNLVARPQILAAPGTEYSYQSGLVLANNGSPITRDIMINEFSQGSGTVGTPRCEWVELVVLKNNTSFRNWSLRNSTGTRLTFTDSAVWDNIPAGKRIVIRTGNFERDLKLPPNDDPDDTNPADGAIIIASTAASHFSQVTQVGSGWPSLAEGGDILSLRNAADQMVAEVSYGTATGGFINIGNVPKGQAAYHTGGSDESANEVANWLVTDANVARDGIVPKAQGDLIISEYINGTTDPDDKGLELFNPSSQSVTLNPSGTAEDYKIEIYNNSAGSISLTVQLAGTIPAGGTFLIRKQGAAFPAQAAQQIVNSDQMLWDGKDSIVLRKGTVVVDCFGDINHGGTIFGGAAHAGNRSLRRAPDILVGDTDITDSFTDPTASGWTYISQNSYDLGVHVTTPKFFGFTANNATFAETAGAAAATGTITLAANATVNTVFTLTSSSPGDVTVQASATIPSGQKTVSFPIDALDDEISDGDKAITIQAAATGYQTASVAFNVTDNEPPTIGVTPGKGNNVVNTAWIASVASGMENTPALFRLGEGSSLPPGLLLDSATGLLSGTTDAGAAGTYNIVIERYNSKGQVTSQSFTLTLGTELGYAAWITGYPGLSSTDPEADADDDGLDNLIEFHLGLNPGSADSAVITTERTASALSITYRRAKNLGGTTAGVEWSDDLGDIWSTSGVTEEVLEDNSSDQLVKASVAITGADTKKFIRLKVEQEAP